MLFKALLEVLDKAAKWNMWILFYSSRLLGAEGEAE